RGSCRGFRALLGVQAHGRPADPSPEGGAAPGRKFGDPRGIYQSEGQRNTGAETRMKRFPIVLVVVALGAAGFAAASIASGGHFVQMLTGTGDTVTTPTVTTVTTTPTTTGEQGGGGRRVTLCH